MYRCWNCGYRFKEPCYEELSYEEYCGVDDMFPKGSQHYFTLKTCPSCGSEEIEESYEENNE